MQISLSSDKSLSFFQKYKKQILFFGGIALLFLVFLVFFVFKPDFLSSTESFNLTEITGKKDDWQFSATSKAISRSRNSLQLPPFFEFWYGYLIAASAIIFLLIPVLILIHGCIKLLKNWKNLRNPVIRVSGLHKILIGLPISLILFSGMALLISEFYQIDNYFFVISLAILPTIIAIISELMLLIKGAYQWLKFRQVPLLRKSGRNKFLFGIYNLIFLLVIPFFALNILWGMSNLSYSTVSGGSGFNTLSAPGSSVGVSMGIGGAPFGNSMFSGNKSMADQNIGLSVGGAKDINNFRENIKNNYLPLPTDITYEGLFYDYLFDTGANQSCFKLFCPSYTTAISPDPFSKKDEYLLSVGLNSGIQKDEFRRKKLNLVVVLDVSGSMSSSFNSYYYDQFGKRINLQNENEEESGEDTDKSKMKVATEATVALLNHLNPEDSFGMVLFDDTAYLAKPLAKVARTDMDAIKNHILEISPQGGTNMSAGMAVADEQFKQYLHLNPDEYENRIIFITDAQPNGGDLTPEGMLGTSVANADQKIYTTYIGVGVDFNTELIEKITKMRGANYYAVHSPTEFKKRMDTNFNFMVTPLVFNLQLKIQAPGFKIKKVYGSPEASESTGEIMKVNTLFPSENTAGETRGGLVLVQMEKISDNNQITISSNYEDRNGQIDGDTIFFNFENRPEYYDNSGIHKGILLSRYINLLKNWIIHERAKYNTQSNQPPNIYVPEINSFYAEGIPILGPSFELGEWERKSQNLSVSPEYKQLFLQFKDYFEYENLIIADPELNQEIEILETLISH